MGLSSLGPAIGCSRWGAFVSTAGLGDATDARVGAGGLVGAGAVEEGAIG